MFSSAHIKSLASHHFELIILQQTNAKFTCKLLFNTY